MMVGTLYDKKVATRYTNTQLKQALLLFLITDEIRMFSWELKIVF